MSTPTQPTPAPGKKINRIGLEPVAYRGSKTTLCAGCGHNAITERIIDSFWELGINPDQVLKLSGIGCSSKAPAYFLNSAHGFNSVHGRMPSVGTVRATQFFLVSLETARCGWSSSNHALAAQRRQMVERLFLRATFRANHPRVAASRAAFGQRHRRAGRIHAREAWQ